MRFRPFGRCSCRKGVAFTLVTLDGTPVIKLRVTVTARLQMKTSPNVHGPSCTFLPIDNEVLLTSLPLYMELTTMGRRIALSIHSSGF